MRLRLEAEAKHRRISMAAFIREAIDARFHSAALERRQRAVAEMKAMSGGRFQSTGTLEQIVDEEREPRALRRRRRG